MANILDGLAWAGISEKARVARISARLVRELGFRDEHTKSHVKDAIRSTSPPFGRSKFIFEAVEKEYRRQLPIYRERQAAHGDWEQYKTHMAKRSTRLNLAYAAAFGRPDYAPTRSNPHPWHEYDARAAWDAAERERDKGDKCVALTHQNGYVVCLMTNENESDAHHIAVRYKNGPITRTYLRTNYTRRRDTPENFVEAIVSLGGPKVKAALAQGKKVVTDWVGRRTFIHHEGQDHHHPHIEEIPWRVVTIANEPTGWQGSWQQIVKPAMVLGDKLWLVDEERYPDWNDVD
jgi:hypothetical protein